MQVTELEFDERAEIVLLLFMLIHYDTCQPGSWLAAASSALNSMSISRIGTSFRASMQHIQRPSNSAFQDQRLP